MKRYAKVLAVLFLLMFGTAASESAIARSGGGSGHGGGYSHGGGYGHGYGYRGVGIGVALGVPLFGLGYYSAPYYSYPAYAYPAPAYAVPAPAGAYVEQGYAQAAPAAQQDWYYCPDSNAYYPYVRECPDGWQRVPAQPPR